MCSDLTKDSENNKNKKKITSPSCTFSNYPRNKKLNLIQMNTTKYYICIFLEYLFIQLNILIVSISHDKSAKSIILKNAINSYKTMFFNVLSSESNDQRWNQRFETQSCKIGSLNVNGLRTNTDMKVLPLMKYIVEQEYDIFMLNETWTNSFTNLKKRI